MKRTAIAIMAAACLLLGCDPEEFSGPKPATTNITCLCVGMENSQRFGSCSGCKNDSDRMNSLLSCTYGYPTVLLQSKEATRDAVISNMAWMVSMTPTNGMFVFYYSGHGGQESLPGWGTSEPEGKDQEDEYLCLWDSYLLDDELWAIISRCRGRVFCIFDCCHSETMYRDAEFDSIVPEYLKRSRAPVAVALGVSKARPGSFGFSMVRKSAVKMGLGQRMLFWSGCQEKEYSYGGSDGGVMTNEILKNRVIGEYVDVWDVVKAEVEHKQPTQHPVSTVIGPEEAWHGEVFK